MHDINHNIPNIVFVTKQFKIAISKQKLVVSLHLKICYYNLFKI